MLAPGHIIMLSIRSCHRRRAASSGGQRLPFFSKLSHVMLVRSIDNVVPSRVLDRKD